MCITKSTFDINASDRQTGDFKERGTISTAVGLMSTLIWGGSIF